MKDTLYGSLCRPENLKRAFEYLKHEIKNTSLPLDPIWTPVIEAIDKNPDRYFSTLSWMLLVGKYKPSKSSYVLTDKDTMRNRKVAILAVTDRIVYQALLNQDVLGSAIRSCLSPNCYSPKISKNGNDYFDQYKPFWENYINGQIASFNAGFVWRAEFDVERYFDNINQARLIKILENTCSVKSIRTLDLLKQMLTAWSSGNPVGIPQGPFASLSLGNIYLDEIDRLYERTQDKNRVRFYRYQDDMVIMAKELKDLKLFKQLVTETLHGKQLSLNGKSKLSLLKNTKELQDLRFSNPYDDITYTAVREKVRKISPNVPIILEKIRNTENVAKNEIGNLKYYFKAADKNTAAYFKEILETLPLIDHLVPLICRYLENNFDPDVVFDDLYEVYRKEVFYKWGKFWLLKLLLSLQVKHVQDFEDKRVLLIANSLMESDWFSRSIGIYAGCNFGIDKAYEKLGEVLGTSNNLFEEVLYIKAGENYIDRDLIKDKITNFLRLPDIDAQITAISVLGDSVSQNNVPSDSDIFTKTYLGSNTLAGEKKASRGKHTNGTRNTTNIYNYNNTITHNNISQFFGFGADVGDKPKPTAVGPQNVLVTKKDDIYLIFFRTASCRFDVGSKAGELLVFMDKAKNMPIDLGDIQEKCNPKITNTSHRFKTNKDVNDTILNIKKNLEVNGDEFFPINRQKPGTWFWEDRQNKKS